MKEVIRQIVKMADIGLVKLPQLIELMDGVKIVFRSGKAESILDGQYIMIGGRKHRFDTSEIRGILIHRDQANPEAVRKLEGFTKIETFMVNHLKVNKHGEATEDCVIRLLQGFMQSEDRMTDALRYEGLEDDREKRTEKAITSKAVESPTPDASTGSDVRLSDKAAGSIGQPDGSG